MCGIIEPRHLSPTGKVMLLTTPTAIKVDGIPAWIHASHVKLATLIEEEDEAQLGWKVQTMRNLLKLKVIRRTGDEAPSPGNGTVSYGTLGLTSATPLPPTV